MDSASRRIVALQSDEVRKSWPLRLIVSAIVLSFVQVPTGLVPEANAQRNVSQGNSRSGGDSVAWRTARRENTCSSYALYLKQFPRGRYMRDARASMKNCGQRKGRKVRRSESSRWGYYPRYRYPIWPRHRYRPWPRPPIAVRPPLPMPPVVDPDWGVEPPPMPDIDPDWGVDVGGGFDDGFDAMPLPSFDFD